MTEKLSVNLTEKNILKLNYVRQQLIEMYQKTQSKSIILF